MKTLNLVYPDKSDIKYTVQKFPDGQQNVVINNIKDTTYNIEFTKLSSAYKTISRTIKAIPESITIKARLNNFKDLELIICAVASLRELGVEEIHLYAPYILGARSDRKFEDGGNNYIKSVIAPIINSLNFKTVTCIDPHSNVLEACINNFKKEGNTRLVNWGLANIQAGKGNGQSTNLFKDCVLVSPDAGASHKIYKLAGQIGYKGDIITCSKERDNEGKLTQVNVPLSFNHVGKDLIIIDDICDGGATFLNIAKEAKRQFEGSATKNKIYLIVTHGIFSKGFSELSKYFNGIYCTNSYRDIGVDGSAKFGDWMNFKQLNVF